MPAMKVSPAPTVLYATTISMSAVIRLQEWEATKRHRRSRHPSIHMSSSSEIHSNGLSIQVLVLMSAHVRVATYSTTLTSSSTGMRSHCLEQ
jgi:hypothetical protein